MNVGRILSLSLTYSKLNLTHPCDLKYIYSIFSYCTNFTFACDKWKFPKQKSWCMELQCILRKRITAGFYWADGNWEAVQVMKQTKLIEVELVFHPLKSLSNINLWHVQFMIFRKFKLLEVGSIKDGLRLDLLGIELHVQPTMPLWILESRVTKITKQI